MSLASSELAIFCDPSSLSALTTDSALFDFSGWVFGLRDVVVCAVAVRIAKLCGLAIDALFSTPGFVLAFALALRGDVCSMIRWRGFSSRFEDSGVVIAVATRTRGVAPITAASSAFSAVIPLS